MKHIHKLGDGEDEYIDTEMRDLDEQPIIITNADGFGACDITIGTHTITWKKLDILKQAIAEAEKLWRI